MPSARLQQHSSACGNAARVNRRTQRSTNCSVIELLASSYAYPAQHHAGRGWLTWEAEVGRGKRSRLTFSIPGWRFSNSGRKTCWSRIDRPTSTVGWRQSDCAANAGFHLGRSFRQGRHILRVLYYRPCVICYLAAHCAVPKPILPGNLQFANAHK